MKIILRIFLFVLLALCFSCEDKGWFADCDDCTTTEPELTDLVLKLKSIGKPVHVNVYEGELEDSVLYDFADVGATEYTFLVRLHKKYTVTATYYLEGNTYTAIDSATPKVKYTEDQCDDACYYVYDKVVDLRLKYTAKGN
jgi:hypothetical protein